MNFLKMKIRKMIPRSFRPHGIQGMITIAFTGLSIGAMLVLGFIFYGQYAESARKSTISITQQLLEQTGENLEEYLTGIRQMADTASYDVIRENDVGSTDLERELSLLYEANQDNILSIAIYDDNGSLLAAEPVAQQKEDPDVTHQSWFTEAGAQIENFHVSTPHVQNLFDDGTYSYHWVISLSREIDINAGDVPMRGVLLVDMNFSTISRMMEKINDTDNGQYYYLCDSSGKIIYHPAEMKIREGLARESAASAACRTDGVYEETFGGKKRNLVIRTISYTGWKLVGVIPESSIRQGMGNFRIFIFLVFDMTMMALILLNHVVSSRISRPILALNRMVSEHEAGREDAPRIAVGGSTEIRHLGMSIQRSYDEIDELMKRIVHEQNVRRKSEIDALQSQINPHFLYNTLDSITWMVEGEKNEEAVVMISELAKLLRISLSGGRTIIRVQDEIQHARSYMNIQKVRYKERFETEFDVSDDILDFCTVKLIVQPLLENAIYYGVGEMDPDDGGKIRVTGRRDGGDIVILVEDNGMGMTEDMASHVLTDTEHVRRRGSGVGLRNVHNRIRLIFGEAYGLTVESEPDRGTRVTIRIPAIPFSDENRKKLEDGIHET